MEQTILTPNQRAILEQASNDKHLTDYYYFTGGTALSEFYLHHRLSEDLDFFTIHTINTTFLKQSVTEWGKNFHVKDIQTIVHHDGMVIFTMVFPDESTLKIDFVKYSYKGVERGKTLNKLSIDSVFDIALNKMNAILDRLRARDFVDLYCILTMEDISLEQIMLRMNDKFDPYIFENMVNIGSRFCRVEEVTDYPTMLVPFDKQKMINFYLAEAKKLEPKIFK
jgi:predicted nucleotidyltransferase component of viral defense system